MNRKQYDWKSIMDIRCERNDSRIMDYACYALCVLTFGFLIWCVLFDAPHIIPR